MACRSQSYEDIAAIHEVVIRQGQPVLTLYTFEYREGLDAGGYNSVVLNLASLVCG